MRLMMNDEKLLECPFCGSLRVESVKEDVWTFIHCVECGGRSDDWIKEENAVNKWNTRGGLLYTADDYKQDAEEREHGL